MKSSSRTIETYLGGQQETVFDLGWPHGFQWYTLPMLSRSQAKTTVNISFLIEMHTISQQNIILIVILTLALEVLKSYRIGAKF